MKKLIGLFSLLAFSFSSFAQNKYNIIPKPTQLLATTGEFLVNAQTKILIPKNAPEIRPLAEIIAERFLVTSGITLAIEEYELTSVPILKNQNIIFSLLKNKVGDQKLGEEDYVLKVASNGILLSAATSKGDFYALQSLLQLLPPQIFSSSLENSVKWAIPNCTIFDHPRYTYRGLMLDVGRHFFPVSFIKKYIDLLAMHKMNTFHWHLTEDQGWRIEIKKYPKLTEIGSKRKETMKGHYNEQQFDGKPYGGFYTQDQIREVVAYAQKKYVNIIPEIEMPGHALAALAAYPELGCGKSSYEVGTKWGVYDDVFCPTEQTFTFLEDVLTEVIALFPSNYIHIGGDECPKVSWKNSQFCQDLIKKEGLKDEHELQSYFIKRIDKFLTSKGKKMIGWDEILEGGISPNATIMSWRGIEGGIAAVKQNHDAIMTPGSHCYLDHYQSDPSSEPLAIGGFLPLEKVYSYDPTPKGLTPEQANHILGVQANLWTEYIPTSTQAEYMVYPRASALAEVAWTANEAKDYKDFTNRLKTHFKRLRYLAVNYSNSYYDISATSSINVKNQVVIKLQTSYNQSIIRYTIDGSTPTASSSIYQPIGIISTKDVTLRAAAFSLNGEKLGKDLNKYFYINKATGRKYTLVNQPKNYTGGETFGLTNGVKGEEGNLATWVGFEGKDLDVTIDLGQVMNLNKVSFAFLRSSASWIMLPQEVEVSISNDGKKFTSIQKMPLGSIDSEGRAIQQLSIAADGKKGRFIKIFAKNYGNLPDNHPGKGSSAWLFVDEIGVE
ncbi:family 20 glycosylhydrolase [Emticicia sp.]|uniref:glycoside hydrolase family 20 protein n=1 Tax=Emticicia sp. TaxID=1930953 RepID=UPI0037518437